MINQLYVIRTVWKRRTVLKEEYDIPGTGLGQMEFFILGLFSVLMNDTKRYKRRKKI